MTESLKKAKTIGIVVNEMCISDAFREGQWIHRNGTIYGSPELRDEIAELWPNVVEIKPIGVISDVPEVLH